MSSPTKETTPSQTSPSPRTPDDVRVPVPRPGSPASPITKSPPPPIGTDSTPSNASETTAHYEGDAWDLGLSSLPALTGRTRQFERCSNSRVRLVVGQALSDRSTCRRVGQACPISSWDRSHRTSRDRSDKSVRPVGSCFGRTVPVRPPVEHGCSSTARTAVFDRLMPAVLRRHSNKQLTSIMGCSSGSPSGYQPGPMRGHGVQYYLRFRLKAMRFAVGSQIRIYGGTSADLALHDEMARIIHHRMQANQSPRPNAHINAAVTPNLGVPVEQADHSSSPNHRSPSPNQVVPVAQANHSASPDVKILVGVRPPNNMPNGRVFSPDITVVTTRRFANRRHNQQELPDIIHIPLIDLTLPPYCCSLSPELQPISP
ncbi:hypothetical protein PCASD_11118 [Puccinia coronata f. sp. avenae]|uniref:Uncharacterized protein n=1 Tax=Puccinia coronata f. sp. avenae TaxID=200324 RepID=A0A2N5TB89_9BASI|nr:hypothetical protein PCASD_11118 [Puccinia coronata f. sp. avenae]